MCIYVYLDYFLGISFASVGEAPEPWRCAEDFEAEVVRNPRLDNILVLTCRVLLSRWALDNETRDCNGLSLRDSLVFMANRPCADTLDYCREYLMCWGECAEGPTVELGGLCEMLQCSSRIVYVDRLSSQSSQSGSSQPDFGVSYECADGIGSVMLLLRPGHYDLLYSKTGIDLDAHFDPVPVEVTNDFYYYCNVAAEVTGRPDLALRASRHALCLNKTIVSIEELTRELIDIESCNIHGKFGLLTKRNDAFSTYFSVLTANADIASDPSSLSIIQFECLLGSSGFDIMNRVEEVSVRRRSGFGYRFDSSCVDPSLAVM